MLAMPCEPRLMVSRTVVEVAFQPRAGSMGRLECVRLPALFARFPPAGPLLEALQFHAWVFVTAGQCQHLVDFENHPCHRGSVLHLAPGQVHRWDPRQGLDGFALLVGLSSLREPGERAAGGDALDLAQWPTHLRLPGDSLQTLLPLLHRLAELSQHHDERPVTSRLQWHLCLAVLLEVSRHSASSSVQSSERTETSADLRRVSRFKALLERSFRKTREARWYARALGCSVRTLDRSCQACLGGSAKSHIDARVILEAKRRLAHSSVTLELLADELGFSEATNFAKFFRRGLRLTAGAFRARYR